MSEEYNYLFKTNMVGDFSAKDFFAEDDKVTIGVDFHTKVIIIDTIEGSIRCKLQLWVFSSLERFKSIRSMYYCGSSGVILVFDLTNPFSFENLHLWIHEIKANVRPEIPILLVGNKSDLIDKRAVFRDEIDRFRQQFNLNYIETSAKTGDRVNECFYTLTCMMVGEGVI
jgi:small GTP-binding protein